MEGTEWVLDLICKGGYRHHTYSCNTVRRAFGHARRFERLLRAAHYPGVPLPLYNCHEGEVSWPDGTHYPLPAIVVPELHSPRGHLREV
jgi:hypothetical protein